MGSSGSQELTRREREIAEAYANGASHREIGARLFIAPATVRTHLGTIYRKLGVSSKIALLKAMEGASPVAIAGMTDGPGPARVERRASLAIMPFRPGPGGRDPLAEGLVQDVITRLSKLRGVRVTARGSVFALAESGVPDEEAGRMLGVDYLAVGTLRRSGEEIAVEMRLVDTASADILWAERFDCRASEVFGALDRIGDRIVGSLASEIERSERNRAMLKHPDSLSAWESFHRGLWHMYQFTAVENERAQRLFRQATLMDPTFARAYAGLSFTHFQNAFLLRPSERREEAACALDAAAASLAADDRDPTAHWAMGRALWLAGSDKEAVAELRTSVSLSPSFTPGHYALAFVNSQSGDAEDAIGASDHARELSPFDPLLFGMLGARAMALFRLGALEEAADWAVSAATRPNAHVHIRAIAALCLSGAGRIELARSYAALVHRAVPGYRVDDFLAAFRFPQDAQALFRKAASPIGF